MEELIKDVIIIVLLIFYWLWKRYHFNFLQKTNYKETNITFEVLSIFYVAISIIVLVSGVKFWGVFIEIYIAIPIVIALLYVLRHKEEKIEGFYLILKGIYYAGLAIYSTYQYLIKTMELEELALGFALALAIYESIAALIGGIEKIFNNLNK